MNFFLFQAFVFAVSLVTTTLGSSLSSPISSSNLNSNSSFVSSPSASLDPGCIVDIFKYECGNKFYPYKLDDEPAYYGVLAGQYEPGKDAYVGLSVFAGIAYQINLLQLDPPGVELFLSTGPTFFLSDSSLIWYLFNNLNHHYTWVDSQNGEIPPHAIQVGEDRSGFPELIGRIVRPNGLVYVGVVVPNMGVMYYADDIKMSRKTASGYQVLTCKSNVANETQYPTPLPDVLAKPNVDEAPNCINEWAPYNNDYAPDTNGVSAGEYDCNPAYIGKGKVDIFTPGRIQTVPDSGLYLTYAGKNMFMPNGSFYLVDNPNYTYRWMLYDYKNFPTNMVFVRNDIGKTAYPITRLTVNGQTLVGKAAYPEAELSGENGTAVSYANFEVLVCDPWPQYQCGQNWKKYEGDLKPTIDGFNADSTRSGIDGTFIGRSCEINVGEVKMKAPTGVYVLDDFTGNGKLDNGSSNTSEYLVKNASYTYKWALSRGGMQMANALEVFSEGHAPFYIGMTRIDDRVFVGKVRPGQGLFFVDADGNRRSTSSYNVLTCFSSDASFGVWKKDKCNNEWFIEHWCPEGKEWDNEEAKCL